jgi:dTDP-4-amino-4,6-dideoxygalactose transaminase
VLRAQLGRLEEQAETRTRNAAYLAEALSEVKGLELLPRDPHVTRNALHLLKMWYHPERFGGHTARQFGDALQAEGIPLGVGYPEPLSEATVVVKRIEYIRTRLGLPAEPRPDVPVTKDVCARGLWLRQNALLGSQADMDDIVRAARKVQRAWV